MSLSVERSNFSQLVNGNYCIENELVNGLGGRTDKSGSKSNCLIHLLRLHRVGLDFINAIVS